MKAVCVKSWYVVHLLYPILCCWIFKLLPYPGYCKYCCDEQVVCGLHEFLKYLDVNPLSDRRYSNTYFHSVGCLFKQLMVSFAVQKLSSLMQPHLFIFAFIICATAVILKKNNYQSNFKEAFPYVFLQKCHSFVFKSLIRFHSFCEWYKIGI